MDYKFNAKETKDKLVKWIKDLFENDFKEKNCCVALSGGKDSSIVAALCAEALGKDRVKGIMLPYHKQKDIDCSLLCAVHLDIDYEIVNIGKTVDSIIEEMKSKEKITITDQALINVPARVRMTELYFYAQCVNGIPSCNCNLSEDFVGYATFGGDGFGSFAPLSNLTVTEVLQIGEELGLPKKLIYKTPIDGLCGKTDEENLGFSYAVLDKYIRTGEIEDDDLKQKIDEMHQKNLFKLLPMPSFKLED
jgi:NAD+ synthase